MALFDNFPYTNFHELNLDWLIKKVEEIDSAFPEGTVGIEKGGTGADNAADARDNLGIFAMNIPTSAIDPTTIETRLQSLASDISALDGNIDYRIFRSVTKIGQTAGTATLGSCWAAMSVGDILICPPSDFNPAQVPETSGTVIMVRNGGSSGSLRFYGNNTYEMPFVSNYPSGEWRQLVNSTDVIPVANGGTGATNAVQARQNLGIDFSGTVLSVSNIGADTAGNVPLQLLDTVYSSITDMGLAVGSTITAVWTALEAGQMAIIPATEISNYPSGTAGVVMVMKQDYLSNPGFIKCIDKDSGQEWNMGFTGTAPSNTWIRVINKNDLMIGTKYAPSITVTANSGTNSVFDVDDEDGWTPIGVMGGYSGNGSLIMMFYSLQSNNTVSFRLWNPTNASITTTTAYVKVLYVRS